jgi:MFS family permease
MADRSGAHTVFRSAIGVFMLGSILCGVFNAKAEFVATRFLQGIGGASIPELRCTEWRITSVSIWIDK